MTVNPLESAMRDRAQIREKETLELRRKQNTLLSNQTKLLSQISKSLDELVTVLKKRK